MTSANPADGTGADVGLLSPGRAGSAAEATTGDAAFLQAMLDAEAALARAQAAVGLAPTAAADAITAAAVGAGFDVRELALRARSGGNPVIPLVADLTAAAGRDAAPYVHRGATSQDIVDTAMMLVAARTVPLVLAELDRTARALAALATAHRTTPMPARTLTQHAVPTTFGLKTAGWHSLVRAARDRLGAVRLPAQLGGAAGTLAAFAALDETSAGRPGGQTSGPPDRSPGVPGGGPDSGLAHGVPGGPPGGPSQQPPPAAPHPPPGEGPDDPVHDLAGTAPGSRTGPPPPGGTGADDPRTDTGIRLLAAYSAELGLAEPLLPWHTLRTPVADLGSALAFATGALGKMAADVLVLSRTEIGEVAEADGGGSSAMPHKRNPVRAALIAAAARQAPALASVLMGALVAEDERPAGAWHSEWQPLRELLRLTGGAARDAAELAHSLRVFPDRMRDNLGLTHGLLLSERLAAALAPAVGRDRAKHLITAAARLAANAGIPLAQALTETDPSIAELIPEGRMRDLTDPAGYTGSAPALVDRALADRGPADRDPDRGPAIRARADRALADHPEDPR